MVAGLVVAMRTMKSKRGDRIAFLTLDDKSGRLEVSLFGETFAQHQHLLEKDALLVIEGEVSMDDYTGNQKMVARKLAGIAQAREQHAKALIIKLDAREPQHSPDMVQQLVERLTPYQEGHCKVEIQYRNEEVKARFELDECWTIKPEQPLINQLKSLLGIEAVDIVYS